MRTSRRPRHALAPLLVAAAAAVAVACAPRPRPATAPAATVAPPVPWEVVRPYPPEVRQAVAARLGPRRLLRLGGPTTVYLAFDGATIASGAESNAPASTSWIPFEGACGGRATATIPAFDATPWSAHGTRDQVIATVTRLLGDIYAGYDIHFVTTRPGSGHYTMTIIGGACDDAATLCQPYGTLGVSPLDCTSADDLNPNPDDVNFICSDSIAGFGLDLTSLVYTIAHEDAHTFGLAHIDRQRDIMFWALAGGSQLTWGTGAVRAADGSCSADGQQADGLYLGRAIGGSGRNPDTAGPRLALVWPPDGASVTSPFDVRVTATDASGVADVTLAVDGADVRGLGVAPFVFGLANLTPGPHVLALRATDWFYADAAGPSVTVTVTVPPDPCAADADCGSGRTCSAGRCAGGAAPAATGASCSVDADCAGGRCVADAEPYCSQTCVLLATCPDGFDCQASLCVVMGVPPGATGAACASDADCTGGRCADPANDGYCTAPCDPAGAPCPNGGACDGRGDGGGALCGRTPSDVAPSSSGCAAAAGAAPAAPALALALALALTGTRRRRRR
jgi:Cys-rich repeat protein